MRPISFFWVRVAVSFIAIAIICWVFRNRFGEVLAIIKNVEPAHLILAFLLLFTSQLIITARLREILLAQEIEMGYFVLFLLTLVALFFNNFLPSAVGGDVVKAYYTSKRSQKKLEPYTAVFTDRAIGYVTLISWSVIALWFYGNRLANPAVAQSIYVMLAVAVTMVCFFGSRRFSGPYHWVIEHLPSDLWKRRLNNVYNSVSSYRKHPRLILLAVFISAIAQFTLIFMFWVLAKGIHLDIHLGTLILIMPIIGVVQNAPSLNGIGVRESAYVFFLRDYITAEGALALSLLFYFIYLLLSLCGGVIYALWGGARSHEAWEAKAAPTFTSCESLGAVFDSNNPVGIKGRMTIRSEYLRILACPSCKASLQEEENYLICSSCHLKYPIRNGIPILLVERAEK